MSKMKLITSLMLAFALLSMQVGTVLAAPPLADPAPISGTVQSITPETDSAGVITVLVTLDDGAGGISTVRLSVETAVSLGLVSLDATGAPVVNIAAIGTSVTIDPTMVIVDEEAAQHPVGSALADFFTVLLGVDYDTIMSVHEQGVGFGVIAQALWLTDSLDGDSELFKTIVDAKQSGDYSAIVLPDGTSPQNWGQFRKSLLGHKQNLGQIMSGHADNVSDDTTTTTTASPSNGNNSQSRGHGKGKGRGNGNGHKP
jgi:hypothetical protein